MDFRKTVIQTLLFVSILKVSLSFGDGIFSSVFVNFSLFQHLWQRSASSRAGTDFESLTAEKKNPAGIPQIQRQPSGLFK